jgi:predicted kinase
VALLPFYLTYRAMVRAKIACLRMNQVVTVETRSALRDEFRQYIRLAKSHGQGRPAIVLMHGLAGSGKTTMSEHLLQRIGAIRLRTDIERKRIHGLDAEAQTHSPVARGIYTEVDTQHVYERICVLARAIVGAGCVAIADGAFLKRWERDLFRKTAASVNVPFIIIDCTAPLHTLRRRVAERLTSHHDPSEATIAVLEAQLAVQEPLAPDERPAVVTGEDEFIGWLDRQYPARPSGATTFPRWILKSTMKYATARGVATTHHASAVRRLASGTTPL